MTENQNPQMIAEVVKPYGPGNPHPMYGKDPNIINECGHTHYPKWIIVASGEKALAKDAKHEKALLEAENKADLVLDPPLKSKKGWDKDAC